MSLRQSISKYQNIILFLLVIVFIFYVGSFLAPEAKGEVTLDPLRTQSINEVNSLAQLKAISFDSMSIEILRRSADSYVPLSDSDSRRFGFSPPPQGSIGKSNPFSP